MNNLEQKQERERAESISKLEALMKSDAPTMAELFPNNPIFRNEQ